MNVVCVYYGNKYGTEYVQKLYNMVQRHLTIPHKFYCFTDHPRMNHIINGDILCKPFHLHDEKGWWNKMLMYSKDCGLEGPNLYLDLDVVILKNINCFALWGDDETIGVINDFNGFNTNYNSSILKFNTSITDSAIYQKYMTDRPRYRREQGDQNVMSMLVKNHPNVKVMPDEWSQSYKWYDRKDPRFEKGKWDFTLRPETKICVFHGQPNPHESEQEWVKNNWS